MHNRRDAPVDSLDSRFVDTEIVDARENLQDLSNPLFLAEKTFASDDNNESMKSLPLITPSDETVTSRCSTPEGSEFDFEMHEEPSSFSSSFLCFRLNFLLVTLVIMLADGLQGKFHVQSFF
jgi:hypothetical protein